MLNKILALSKNLISVPSTKENPKALKKVFELAKNEIKEFSVEEFEKNGVLSFLAYNCKSRPKKFKIILNAHIDVVAAKENQYRLQEKDGKLYGRGSYDMKAATAAEILVFKELAKQLPYPIGLQIVTDEEIGGHCGTKLQIDKGVRATFVIAGEPTDFLVNNIAKGVVWLDIIARGKTAHGAYLWEGENAVNKIVKAIHNIHKVFPVPEKEVWQTTFNLSWIKTANETANKVPDYAEARFDIRYIPEDKDQIIKNLRKLISESLEIKILEIEPAHFTSDKNPYINNLLKTIKKINKKPSSIVSKHFASDVRHYNRVGCDGVTFGPKGFGLHTDNEYVNIKSLENYYLILKQFLLSL